MALHTNYAEYIKVTVELRVGTIKVEYLANVRPKRHLSITCSNNFTFSDADAVETAGKDFVDCLKNLINFETVQKEIEEAKPRGALDEVFGKYCGKSSELKTCIHNLNSAVSPCVEKELRDKMPDIDKAADQLIDFVCYKDGDRIALFISEHGPECFRDKAEDIRECANKLKNEVGSVDAAKSLALNEQCGKFDTLTSCIVKALEGCDTPTPGNMAESLFKFVRKGSPCKDIANVTEKQ